MSQVSTEAFDFIFAAKNKLEDRVDRLEGRVRSAQYKLDKVLTADELTASQLRRVEKLESQIAERTDRLETLQEDLDGLINVLPKDEFKFTNFRRDMRDRDNEKFYVTLELTDSPYDDTFVGGEKYKLRMSGQSVGKSSTSTRSFGGDAEMVDGVFSITAGGLQFGRISRMDFGTIEFLNGDSEVLYTYNFSNVVD